jgi:phosphate uptake regulator
VQALHWLKGVELPDPYAQRQLVLRLEEGALDDDVDELYDSLEARDFLLLQRGGPATERLGRFLLAGRQLERVGDNACKIAEKAVYAIMGERRPEYFPALAHRATTGVRPTGHTR